MIWQTNLMEMNTLQGTSRAVCLPLIIIWQESVQHDFWIAVQWPRWPHRLALFIWVNLLLVRHSMAILGLNLLWTNNTALWYFTLSAWRLVTMEIPLEPIHINSTALDFSLTPLCDWPHQFVRALFILLKLHIKKKKTPKKRKAEILRNVVLKEGNVDHQGSRNTVRISDYSCINKVNSRLPIEMKKKVIMGWVCREF